MDTTLKTLLTGCRKGDDEAVTELVRRFQPWALDLAQAFVHDRDLAEDAVQEAFLTALERLPSLRDDEAFPGWFRQIIRTHACRITRSRREVVTDKYPEPPDVKDSPQRRLERHEIVDKVKKALQNLPPATRETATLYYLDERRCREIAHSLRIPEGTVKRRLHDARKCLRGMLSGYAEDES